MSLTSQNDLLLFSLNMNGFAKLEHVMTSTIILTISSVMHAGVGRIFSRKGADSRFFQEEPTAENIHLPTPKLRETHFSTETSTAKIKFQNPGIGSPFRVPCWHDIPRAV